jgi:hypothetical protein
MSLGYCGGNAGFDDLTSGPTTVYGLPRRDHAATVACAQSATIEVGFAFALMN